MIPARRAYGALVAPLMLACSAAGALEVPLDLRDEAVQGGLIVAQTAPAARVQLDGRVLRVSPEGVFLVGFGRDAPPVSTLTVVLPGGARREHRFEVAARRYDVQRIDGLERRKVEPAPEDLARIRADAALVRDARARDDPRTDFLDGFRWPLRGRVTGVYGSQRILNGEPRRPHFGVDVAAPVGTPVAAPAPGVVTLAHRAMFFSGGTLILDHGHGLSSSFLHLSRIRVGVGERVAAGAVIAEVGATGRVTGAHLDWRVNLFERRLDPAVLAGPMTPAP